MLMLRAMLNVGLASLLLVAVAPAADKAAPKDAPVDKDAVNKAIGRGVAYLKKSQRQDGSWPWGKVDIELPPGAVVVLESHPKDDRQYAGATCLAGLALLEADIPAKDPAVQAAADYVRKAVPELTFTHSVGAAILFLDRHGDQKDEILIKTLAARLLAAQCRDGGWAYQCPKIATDTVRAWDTPEKFLAGIARLPRQASLLVNLTENSTAEFAVMGLWVARRHGVPAGPALAKYENFCRSLQGANGSFRYMPSDLPGTQLSPCTTCSGLIGLAYAHGAANELALLKYAKGKNKTPAEQPKPGKGLRDLEKDQALRKGFAALESSMKGVQPALPTALGARAFSWDPEGLFYYMALWSVERVAVTYDRDKIGKIDWYNWGARKLLAQQEMDGSWKSKSKGGDVLSTSTNIDTAWAVLFLRRSNPAPDLFQLLKGVLPPPKEGSTGSGSPTEK
jgi:hypothetical protein